MAFASSRSPTNTRARHSLASRSASSALWLRIAISIAGFSVRAVAAIRPTSIVSGVAITSIRAVATWAWISTAGFRRVAEHRRYAAGAQLLDGLAVLLGDDERDAGGRQLGGDALADPAVADEHDLLRQVLRVGRHRQLGERVGRVIAPRRPRSDGCRASGRSAR